MVLKVVGATIKSDILSVTPLHNLYVVGNDGELLVGVGVFVGVFVGVVVGVDVGVGVGLAAAHT